MTKTENTQIAKAITFLYDTDPAGFLCMAALIAGKSTDRTAAQLARQYKGFTQHAAEAQNILDNMKPAAEDLRAMIAPASEWLHKYFLDPRTPQQKAGDTIRERTKQKNTEFLQQLKDREAARAAAREVLHDPSVSAADRLAAAARLEAMK